MRRMLPLALLVAATTAAQAAPLAVPVDQTRRLPIAGAASSVVVGNTEIADVRAIDSRTLMVIGKRPGVTNVVVLDASGRSLFDEQVTVSAGAGSVVTVFRGGETSEYACSPYCALTDQSSAPAASPAPAATP